MLTTNQPNEGQTSQANKAKMTLLEEELDENIFFTIHLTLSRFR